MTPSYDSEEAYVNLRVLLDELRAGGRYIAFDIVISILVVSFRNRSSVYFVRAGEGAMRKRLWFSLITFALGWWGIPWGPIWTVRALWNNLRGGVDVTDEVVAALGMPLVRDPHLGWRVEDIQE